jgi:hypothetical protein
MGSTQRITFKSKDITYDHLRIQALESMGFEWKFKPPGRPFERACRLSQNPGTAMFLKNARKTPAG